MRRFEGTRRRHPFGGSNVEDAISDERERLRAIRDRADMVLDTGELNVNQLRARVTALFGDSTEHRMQTSVVSFGYKHGVPMDADVVFDCRFLPNPHWQDDLRPLSGLDAPVREYVLAQPDTAALLDRLDSSVGARAPGLRGRREVLPDNRVRVHRGTAPIRGRRRRGRPEARQDRDGADGVP